MDAWGRENGGIGFVLAWEDGEVWMGRRKRREFSHRRGQRRAECQGWESKPGQEAEGWPLEGKLESDWAWPQNGTGHGALGEKFRGGAERVREEMNLPGVPRSPLILNSSRKEGERIAG